MWFEAWWHFRSSWRDLKVVTLPGVWSPRYPLTIITTVSGSIFIDNEHSCGQKCLFNKPTDERLTLPHTSLHYLYFHNGSHMTSPRKYRSCWCHRCVVVFYSIVLKWTLQAITPTHKSIHTHRGMAAIPDIILLPCTDSTQESNYRLFSGHLSGSRGTSPENKHVWKSL